MGVINKLDSLDIINSYKVETIYQMLKLKDGNSIIDISKQLKDYDRIISLLIVSNYSTGVSHQIHQKIFSYPIGVQYNDNYSAFGSYSVSVGIDISDKNNSYLWKNSICSNGSACARGYIYLTLYGVKIN